jgi:hypothetical protein
VACGKLICEGGMRPKARDSLKTNYLMNPGNESRASECPGTDIIFWSGEWASKKA